MELSAERRRDILFASHSDVIGSHIQACGAYEPEVLAAISLVVEKYNLGRGTALDIGANIGNHTLHMAGIFQEVIAFEPSPYISMVLRANVLRNRHDNVQVFECALGDYDGAGQLSELCTENLGMIEVSDYHTMATPQSVRSDSVKVCLGDQLLANIANAPNAITFIKIDVEGMETAALRGLYQTITTSPHGGIRVTVQRGRAEGCRASSTHGIRILPRPQRNPIQAWRPPICSRSHVHEEAIHVRSNRIARRSSLPLQYSLDTAPLMRVMSAAQIKRLLISPEIFAIEAQGIRTLLLAGYLLLSTRLLGPEGYGHIAAALSIAALCGSFVGLGSGTATVRNSARDQAQFPSAWGLAIARYLISGTALSALYLGASWLLLGDQIHILTIALIGVSELLVSPLCICTAYAFLAVGRTRIAACIQPQPPEQRPLFCMLGFCRAKRSPCMDLPC
ncbi:MAG: FkbM family methyltransferase [Gammaproteobacteria bacterium]|nr:FkbM family methyltransferase [Gammaproteobacteria bacterium]